MRMPHRRATALASLALVLAPVLSSCGFDYATDRDYTPGVGVNNREGRVDVLAAVIVSAEAGEGVFVASLANNMDGADESTTLEEITGIGDEDDATFAVPEGITVEPEGFVNLIKLDEPILVTGNFAAGDFVPVVLSFSHGERISMDVIVVSNCDEYADIPGIPVPQEDCAPVDSAEH